MGGKLAGGLLFWTRLLIMLLKETTSIAWVNIWQTLVMQQEFMVYVILQTNKGVVKKGISQSICAACVC